MAALRIVNGKLYDPANGIEGEARDICVQDGKIVASVGEEARRIDATGLVVMPGGVDIHCHIAGPKVNLARKLQPEDHRRDVHPRTKFTRSGVGGTVPSTFATGYRYAAMGYTTAMEAAVPPLGARHALEELHDTPVIDKGFYVLMGNNVLLYQLLQQGRKEEFKQALAWWLNAAKAYAPKLVNPGADEMWKGRRNSNIVDLDEKIEGFDLTPRKVIVAMVEATNQLGLPHPMHIHCNNLGHSGNWETTLETMRACEGFKLHLTHIQFHSYGSVKGKVRDNPTSKAREISQYVNSHPNVSADVGQVMFGKSTSMTADAPLAYMLRQFGGHKWVNADTEHESGCGIIPFEYQDKIYTHALQWAIGLELFLLSEDPWRMVFSTDHPNGGSFMSYPRLIRLLMDREYRNEQLKTLNPRFAIRPWLTASLANTPCRKSPSSPAPGRRDCSGLQTRATWASAPMPISPFMRTMRTSRRMFEAPRYVIKDGEVIIEDHEFRADHAGRVLHVAPPYDAQIEEVIRPFFEEFYSVRFGNYAVDDQYLHQHQTVATTPQ